MSDDINTSMQHERLAGAAAKSEQSNALHEYKQKYLDAINASPWIREHAAILPNEKESLYQFVRDACGGVFVYIPVDAAQRLETRMGATKSEQPTKYGETENGKRLLNEGPTSDTPARQLGEPIWCAACGKMGDHGSGSCPTISHDYAELLPMMNAARMRMESALAAAKAEQSESTARIAGLQARVDQYQQERSDAIDQLAELRAENAELRKGPTMSERDTIYLDESILMLKTYAEEEHAAIRALQEDSEDFEQEREMHLNYIGTLEWLIAFIEQHRRKEG